MSIIRALPSRYFNDATLFDMVREKLFFRHWQYACHSSQLPNPGDYFTFSLFDQDIVIVHGSDGVLRAMYNVCQHRGHKLVEGSGNKRHFVCPYHAWAYRLDGRLRGAPNMQSVEGFDKTGICVPRIHLQNFLGFLFINLDPDAENMQSFYPGVEEAIGELCPQITQQRFAHEHTADEGCNWLVAIENYNECYHCKGAHPQFASGVIDPKSYHISPFGEGKVLYHSSRPTGSQSAWYDVSGSNYGSFYLWPATSIQIYPGGVVNSYYWRPLAVDDVRVHRGWFSADGTVDDTLQNIIDLDRESTFSEDLALVKSVQRGLQSKGYRPGPLIIDPKGGIESEHSIAHLHQWLREAVDSAPGAGNRY